MDAPGVIHHVIIRGIEKGAIFRDQADREDFIRRLEALIPETQTRCYAWVLMRNHADFLLPQWSVPPGKGERSAAANDFLIEH